jgi:hypothetical protein
LRFTRTFAKQQRKSDRKSKDRLLLQSLSALFVKSWTQYAAITSSELSTGYKNEPFCIDNITLTENIPDFNAGDTAGCEHCEPFRKGKLADETATDARLLNVRKRAGLLQLRSPAFITPEKRCGASESSLL